MLLTFTFLNQFLTPVLKCLKTNVNNKLKININSVINFLVVRNCFKIYFWKERHSSMDTIPSPILRAFHPKRIFNCSLWDLEQTPHTRTPTGIDLEKHDEKVGSSHDRQLPREMIRKSLWEKRTNNPLGNVKKTISQRPITQYWSRHQCYNSPNF